MNDSGDSAGPARGALKAPLDRVVVLHDEIDLPFGEVRARLGGGLAGHNGLKSLKRGFGDAEFWRVRVGVGRPDSTDPEVVSSYVLWRFREPRDEVAALVARAAEEAERLVEKLGSSPMNDGARADQLRGRRAGRGVLRLQRPGSRNAINTQMLAELLEHLAVARADDAVRVLVLSSADHMGLSAGADVKEELDEEGKVRRMQLFADLYDGIVGFPKPTIAVCHGDVVGGGAEIAVACDMRVGGSNLRMRFPGAALGVPVGPARLVTLCGLAAAKYLLLSSRTVGADEALRLGLVNRVAPAAATEDAALELAAAVAAAPARGRRPPEADAPRVGRHRGALADGGRGQVEWQRFGPGLPFR